MNPNAAPAAVHPSGSDAGLRRVLAAMSVFTMLMTIPQVLTIWIGQQAAGVFYPVMERLSRLSHTVVLVWDAAKRQEHLAVRGLDRARPCCDYRCNHLWISCAPGRLPHLDLGDAGRH